MEPKDKTLLEKEVMDKKLENDSAAKLFSRFNLDFDYASCLQSSPSCKGSAYSFMAREKPLYQNAIDISVNRMENPLGSIYGSLFGSSSYGLPCDLGLMRR
ncbi:MAG: hypothetical protein WC852_00635 [Candidatus Nanoarchaeia archaeon]|jgi:hypothetical protein